MGYKNDLFMSIYGLISSDISSYGASTSTMTIYGGRPDIESQTFPSIVIMPIESKEEGSTKTIDTVRTVVSNYIPVTIMVFAKRNKDCDDITEGIMTSIKKNIPGFLLNDCDDANGFLTPNEQKLKLKTISAMFLKR